MFHRGMLEVPNSERAGGAPFVIGDGGMIFPVQLSRLTHRQLPFHDVPIRVGPASRLLARFRYLRQVILGQQSPALLRERRNRRKERSRLLSRNRKDEGMGFTPLDDAFAIKAAIGAELPARCD